MGILKDLQELVEADVITDETAVRIQDYYHNKRPKPTNRLFIVFGILGAMLVGLGTILIIGHNWDELSRMTKTFFAFLPLLIGQLACGFSLWRKRNSVAWTESSAAFLFFAVGASIALVSQVYNIPGDPSTYILTWMLLCLPLIYVMKSSITSLLYLVGITYYACLTNYWSFPPSESYLYWLLFLGALPHYYLLYKRMPESNFMIFHNWFVPLSVIITLGTIAKDAGEFMFLAYTGLFGALYLIGDIDFFAKLKLRNHGYTILGSLGTIVVLLTLSFDWIWEELRNEEFQFNELIVAPEIFAAVILSLVAGALLYLQQKNKPITDIKPLSTIFIPFIAIFIIGLFSPIAVLLINLLVLGIGILFIREGAVQNHLGILNFGLMVITALVFCRFFDTNLSFVLRGVLFILVGVGFFATNYWMLKKRKTDD